MALHAVGWGVIFTALALLFCLSPLTEARACVDERTEVLLLTDAGVETLTMAEYLPGAVAAEMPADFGAEALKAQAVAARTYALACTHHDNANVCTESACCLAYRTEDELRTLWGGDFEENMRAVAGAVRATDGQVLTYGGELILAAFHASSPGATEASGSLWSALPYLQSVESPETESAVPGLVSEISFTPSELCERLGLSPEAEPESLLGERVLDSSGRVDSIDIDGRSFAGSEVRAALGLKSAAFSARFENGMFIFTVSGSGHGVGMSQYGAFLLAADGWSYDAILRHYYPGAELTQMGQQG